MSTRRSALHRHWLWWQLQTLSFGTPLAVRRSGENHQLAIRYSTDVLITDRHVCRRDPPIEVLEAAGSMLFETVETRLELEPADATAAAFDLIDLGKNDCRVTSHRSGGVRRLN